MVSCPQRIFVCSILRGDILRDNQYTLEIGQQCLQFSKLGVAIAMDDVSSELVIVQAQVTLDETIRIWLSAKGSALQGLTNHYEMEYGWSRETVQDGYQ